MPNMRMDVEINTMSKLANPIRMQLMEFFIWGLKKVTLYYQANKRNLHLPKKENIEELMYCIAIRCHDDVMITRYHDFIML
jgi:hypothetical protein